MENKKGNLSTVFLVIAIILIGVMGYMMYQMNSEIKQLSEKVANSENATANDTVIENNKEVEDIADITAKCKTAFEEYYDLKVEIYSGGSLYALKKLDLVSTTPVPEQYETTTYEFDEFYKTDIKYSEFKNAMLKYITGEFLEKDIEKYYAKNVNGYLHITAMGGTATYIDIDKFELSSNDKGVYTFNVLAERSYDDNPGKDIINLKVTFEKQNGNYVVSNVEDDEYDVEIEMSELESVNYSDNAQLKALEDKYKGKTVKITGYVSNFGDDDLEPGRTYVNIGNSTTYKNKIYAGGMTSDNVVKGQIDKLEKGQKISIVGVAFKTGTPEESSFPMTLHDIKIIEE